MVVMKGVGQGGGARGGNGRGLEIGGLQVAVSKACERSRHT